MGFAVGVENDTLPHWHRTVSSFASNAAISEFLFVLSVAEKLCLNDSGCWRLFVLETVQMFGQLSI